MIFYFIINLNFLFVGLFPIFFFSWKFVCTLSILKRECTHYYFFFIKKSFLNVDLHKSFFFCSEYNIKCFIFMKCLYFPDQKCFSGCYNRKWFAGRSKQKNKIIYSSLKKNMNCCKIH